MKPTYMKKLPGLLLVAFIVLCSSFTVGIGGASKDFCENFKKITDVFNNKTFDKLKGKVIGDDSDPNDRQFVSLISFDNYISQIVYETDKDISFAAVLNKDLNSAEEMQKELESSAKQMENCLGLQYEYSETKNFLHYTFVFDSGVHVDLSGNYPTEKRRYVNIEISYKK